MNYRLFENELQHLESVFRNLAPNPVLPVDWWRQRVRTLSSSAQLDDHKRRVSRLQEALLALEARASGSTTQEG